MTDSQSEKSQTPHLARKLGLSDAIAIGMGSMIGAGIFSAFIPAAAAAGAGLLVGLVIAALSAFANALSSAQLAVQYPTSGGSYIFGRERLGHWPGFLAGWSFVIGKTASCAAMALTFAYYAVPESYVKPVAIAAIVLLVTVNYFGVTRTAGLTKIIVSCVLLVLGLVIAAGFLGLNTAPDAVAGSQETVSVFDSGMFDSSIFDSGWYGILQSAGLLFFAFAGYARVATMGEEVRDPRRTIPRAIIIALSLTLLLYLIIGSLLLLNLGAHQIADSTEPLVDLSLATGWNWLAPIVRIGAALAALGALLSLITGIGRTSLAMARNQDLPRWLSSVHPKYQVPHRAEIVVGIVIALVVLVADLRGAIGFSSFGVLLYYLVTNISAFTQEKSWRRFPKAIHIFGSILCLVLVATLPWQSIVIGVGVLVVGIAYRGIRMRLNRRRHQDSSVTPGQ